LFPIEKESMELILFAYGLSFFTLGVSVLFSRPKQSEYFFASKIWLLGVFAVLHAVEDWISLFKYIHLGVRFTYINYIQSLLLLVSYVFLFEFSRFIIRKSFLHSSHNIKKHIIYKIYNAPAIYSLATAGLAFLVFLHPSVNGINAAIRYTFGFWGALILGIGLYHYGDSIKKSQNINKLKLYFKISGIAFVFYSILSGIIVDPISYFPGNFINTRTFIEIFGFPAQVLRGICAIVIAIASIKTLDIFKYELINKLNESYENIKKFTQNASHQIKTPLTTLRLQIHLALKKSKTIQEYKDTLLSIDSEIIYLQDLVKNLLILTRIQNINITDSFKTVDIDGIVLETYEEFSIIAQNKGVELDIEKLDYLQVRAEPTLLKILISNLLDNAIKYTKKGKKVTIILSKKILMIKDEGIGIPKDKLKMVFDEFYRVNNLQKEHIKGYGLGLSIVQKIIELHKLKIKITSKEDEGTIAIIKF